MLPDNMNSTACARQVLQQLLAASGISAEQPDCTRNLVTSNPQPATHDPLTVRTLSCTSTTVPC